MSEEQVKVKFGGETSGLDQASKKAERDIGDVGKAAGGLTTVFRSLLGVTRQSFGGAMFAEMKTQIADVTKEAKAAGVEAIGLKEIFGMAFGGITAALSVPALLEFGKRMGEGIEKTAQSAQKLGMSAQTVSQWGAVMQLNGQETQTFVTSVSRLDRALVMAASGSKMQSAVFKELGINAKTAGSNQEILYRIADKFASMPDGPKKMALSMQLFGRAGSAMIPILDQGSEELKKQQAVAEEYGATLDDNLIQKGLRVAEAFNEQKLGAQGVKNVLFDEFAPTIALVAEGMNDMIKEFVKSYREGGTVAVVLGTIRAAVNGLVFTLSTLKLGFTELWDVAQIVLGGLLGTFYTLGQVIWDALHGRFQQAAADFKAGMQGIADYAKQKTNEILDAQSKYADAYSKMWNNSDGKKRKAPKDQDGGDNEIAGMGAQKSSMAEWESQLQQKLMAEKNYFGDSKQEELTFWQAKLALTATGSKDQMAVQTKIFELSKSMAQDQFRQDMENFDYKKQLAKDDYATQIQLEDQKNAEIARLYGVDSAEYTKALREKETMARAHRQELVQIETQRIQTQSAIEENGANTTKAILSTDADMRTRHIEALNALGKLSDSKALAAKQAIEQQQLADERNFENQLFSIKASALQEQLALENLEPAKRRELNNQLLQLETQHSNALLALNARANAQTVAQADATAQQVEQKWKNAMQPVGEAFNSAFTSIFMRTKTVGQAIKGIFTDLGQHMIKTATNAAEHWIEKELAKAAIHKAQAAAQIAVDTTTNTTKQAEQAAVGVAQVLSNAAIAASAAFASTAAIPIVGPALAPEAAAAAYAATSAFAPLASAAGGYDIPTGINPMTQLHEEEMVLPSSLANPIRDMAKMASVGGSRLGSASYSAGAAARAGLSSQSNTFNYQPQHTHQPADLESILQRDGGTMRKWFRNEVRNGSLGLPSGNKR